MFIVDIGLGVVFMVGVWLTSVLLPSVVEDYTEDIYFEPVPMSRLVRRYWVTGLILGVLVALGIVVVGWVGIVLNGLYTQSLISAQGLLQWVLYIGVAITYMVIAIGVLLRVALTVKDVSQIAKVLYYRIRLPPKE